MQHVKETWDSSQLCKDRVNRKQVSRKKKTHSKKILEVLVHCEDETFHILPFGNRWLKVYEHIHISPDTRMQGTGPCIPRREQKPVSSSTSQKAVSAALNCLNSFSRLFFWGQEQNPCQRMCSVWLLKREYLVWEAPGMFKGTYFLAFCKLLPGQIPGYWA